MLLKGLSYSQAWKKDGGSWFFSADQNENGAIFTRYSYFKAKPLIDGLIELIDVAPLAGRLNVRTVHGGTCGL